MPCKKSSSLSRPKAKFQSGAKLLIFTIMEKDKFNELLKEFFKAVKQKKLLIIIDTASKNEKAIFSLVSFSKKNGYTKYSNLLKEIGMKNYGKEDDLFVTYCSSRFSLFILDKIGNYLRGKGVRLPKGWYEWIQRQNCI